MSTYRQIGYASAPVELPFSERPDSQWRVAIIMTVILMLSCAVFVGAIVYLVCCGTGIQAADEYMVILSVCIILSLLFVVFINAIPRRVVRIFQDEAGVQFAFQTLFGGKAHGLEQGAAIVVSEVQCAVMASGLSASIDKHQVWGVWLPLNKFNRTRWVLLSFDRSRVSANQLALEWAGLLGANIDGACRSNPPTQMFIVRTRKVED